MSQSESIPLLGLTLSGYAGCQEVGAERVLYLSLVFGHYWSVSVMLGRSMILMYQEKESVG